MKITEIQGHLIESSCPIENEKILSHPVIAQHGPLYDKKKDYVSLQKYNELPLAQWHKLTNGGWLPFGPIFKLPKNVKV